MMITLQRFSILLLLCLSPLTLQAAAFETVRISDRVYALVGDLGQRSQQNLGHNMTSGFVIADDGVVVIDTGGSYRGAQAIHAAIRKITDKPVKWAINSGGQDHRWLGNGYFKQIGASIIAADAGKIDMQNRASQQVEMSKRNLKEAFDGTEAVYPDHVFADRYTLPVPGVKIELIYTGGGHTPADILIWLPDYQIAFTGDIVFAQRMLGVQPRQGLTWIRTLEYLRDVLQPAVIVPGHGDVTNLATALRDSYDYLVLLRDHAKRALESGAFDPVEATQGLDQSRFSYLNNYSDAPFRSRNALRMAEEVFAEVEAK